MNHWCVCVGPHGEWGVSDCALQQERQQVWEQSFSPGVLHLFHLEVCVCKDTSGWKYTENYPLNFLLETMNLMKHFLDKGALCLLSSSVLFWIEEVLQEHFHGGLCFSELLLRMCMCGWFGFFHACTDFKSNICVSFFLLPKRNWICL